MNLTTAYQGAVTKLLELLRLKKPDEVDKLTAASRDPDVTVEDRFVLIKRTITLIIEAARLPADSIRLPDDLREGLPDRVKNDRLRELCTIVEQVETIVTTQPGNPPDDDPEPPDGDPPAGDETRKLSEAVTQLTKGLQRLQQDVDRLKLHPPTKRGKRMATRKKAAKKKPVTKPADPKIQPLTKQLVLGRMRELGARTAAQPHPLVNQNLTVDDWTESQGREFLAALEAAIAQAPALPQPGQQAPAPGGPVAGQQPAAARPRLGINLGGWIAIGVAALIIALTATGLIVSSFGEEETPVDAAVQEETVVEEPDPILEAINRIGQ